MMTPAFPDRPDFPAFTSQRAYPHLSLLRTIVAAVVLAAVQERGKKDELFFVHLILFYWPDPLTMAVAPRRKEGVAAVQVTRRREEGP